MSVPTTVPAAKRDYSQFLPAMKPAPVSLAAFGEPVETASAPVTQEGGVIAALHTVLSSTYTLSALCQAAHWNVEGINFHELHEMFGEQYDDAAGAVDVIAERIRQLGGYVTVDLGAFQRDSGLSIPTPPQVEASWIAAVLAGHEKVMGDWKMVENVSGASGDLETQDTGITRRQVHAKTIWMLRSLLK